jgi:hypothetical protein
MSILFKIKKKKVKYFQELKKRLKKGKLFSKLKKKIQNFNLKKNIYKISKTSKC